MYWHSLIDSAFGDCCGLVYVCYWWHFRFALQLSTRLRYRSLQSLLMLALCRGKAMGLTVLFPMENRRCRKREQLKLHLQLLFRPADVTMGKRSTAVTDGRKGIWGLRVPKPLRPPLRTVVASPCVGKVFLTVRTV